MNKKQLLLQNEELNARLNEARQELQALHIRLSEAKLEQESRLAALERQTARCAELQAEVDFLKAGLAAGIAGSAAAKDDRAGNAAASNLVATHSPVNTLPIVGEETAEEPDADKQKNDEQAVEGPPEDVSAEEETAVNTPAAPAPKADMPADNTLTDNAQKGDAPRNNLSPDGETPLSESAPQARIPAFSENGLDFESYFNEPAAPAEKGEKTEQKSTEALAAESFIENAAPVPKGQPTNPEFVNPQPTDLQFTDPQTLNYFSKMQERITDFITGHSGVSAKKLTELMMNTGELATDMGTVLCGQEAADIGLINSVGSLSDALARLYSFIESEQKTKPAPNGPKGGAQK